MDDIASQKPDDWVISTGKTTSIREFLVKAFDYVGIKLKFIGNGINEKELLSRTNTLYKIELGKEVVAIDKKYFRPSEVDLLVGDSSKAKKELGWTPKISLDQIVKEMMETDLNISKKEMILKNS